MPVRVDRGRSLRSVTGRKCNMNEYCECSSCGAVYITVKGESWKCRRCGATGLLSDLRKYMNENPDKLHKD